MSNDAACRARAASSVPWVRRLGELLAADAAGRGVDDAHVPPTSLGAVESTTYRWSQPVDRERLHQLVLSRSYVITASEEHRRRLLAQVDVLLTEDEAFAGPPPWPLPYVTEAWRISRY